jgi:dTDP-4-dehydrorhamnose reductase
MGKKILILGQGYIGKKLQEELACDIFETNISTLRDAEAAVNKYDPGVLINCIGFTGRNVDECEQETEKTLTANTFVPVLLAEAAYRKNIRLVHISSGCIFDFDYAKDAPVTEERIPDYFKLFYSRTKIYSERALEALSRKYPVLILRIRVPLDNRPHPKNLLTKLINYKRVIDLPNSVTYIPDFVKAAKYLINKEASGTYNIVAKGALRYPELLAAYQRLAPDFKYEVIDFKALKMERTNLVLSAEKLENSGFKVRGIEEIVQECVKEYVKY